MINHTPLTNYEQTLLRMLIDDLPPWEKHKLLTLKPYYGIMASLNKSTGEDDENL